MFGDGWPGCVSLLLAGSGRSVTPAQLAWRRAKCIAENRCWYCWVKRGTKAMDTERARRVIRCGGCNRVLGVVR